MRRVYGVMAALMLAALPAYAAAQATKPADKPAAKTEQAAKPAAAKPSTVSGTVTAVSSDSLTVKGKTEETTFKVDSKTKVVGTGATHKTDEKKAANEPTVITDFVKVGDSVSVTYHEADGTKTATNVRVRVSKTVK